MPPGAQGVTWQLTGGVVKNIIPAIASTNAIVAAACALEALKLITMCSTGINNYMLCAHRWVLGVKAAPTITHLASGLRQCLVLHVCIMPCACNMIPMIKVLTISTNSCILQVRRYVGLDGVYTHTVAYERDPACPICSPSVPFEVESTSTLQQACLRAITQMLGPH